MLLKRMPMLEGWDDLDRLHGEFGRLFGHIVGNDGSSLEWSRTEQGVRVHDLGDKYHVQLELPGFQLSDLNLQIKEGEMLVEGSREVPEEEGRWIRRERPFGKLHRMLTIPDNVDTENVAATLSLGILTIELPKHQASQRRQIAVKQI